jgi:RNA polymerase sigma factor (sigma-70 family)
VIPSFGATWVVDQLSPRAADGGAGTAAAPFRTIGAAVASDRHAAAARNELAAHLRPALRRLPRRLRTVLVLRYVDGLPDAEVARLVGCSERKVRADVAEAAARLAR